MRCNPDNRQRLRLAIFFHNGDGQLLAFDALFCQHVFGILKGFLQRRNNLLRSLRNNNANAGALGCCLDNYGQTELGNNFLCQLLQVACITLVDNHAGCSRNACRLQITLRSRFIHRNSACQHTTAGVGNACCLQNALQAAIFAVHAMHCIKYCLGIHCAQLVNQISRLQLQLFGIIALFAQRIGDSTAGNTRNFGLRGRTAQNNSNNILLINLHFFPTP